MVAKAIVPPDVGPRNTGCVGKEDHLQRDAQQRALGRRLIEGGRPTPARTAHASADAEQRLDCRHDESDAIVRR
jgi:hypothetical protein